MPGVLLCYSVRQAHGGSPLAEVLLCRAAHQALKGAPGWSHSVVWCISHLEKHPGGGGRVLLYSSVCQAFDGPAFLVQLLMLACGEREAMVMAPPSMHDSAVSPCFHGCLAFLHRHFPPQSPPSYPLDPSSRSPRPGIAPQFLNFSSQPLHLLGDLLPCPGYVWLWQGLSDSHSI